ncbi:probable membrane-associated kinase regulator 5 [Glycine soja]|uniref:Putative membrane-associated kinase regulator 5 n=1 Tax=Glycine soja TaxID=3848 RepID=A0A0B2PZE8_GLYSO|nr:probable membrane-associated kinase regulator 5 [Glycine soja]KHN12927.1 Putative membrane-associated kinase regulator 5 [Glycine soja]RZB44225.1 putative membrane-associated kinase regulator 5 [Glycine soja]
MDALNFLKFWRNATTTTTSEPHLVVETDTESDEEDSFFDLELTLHDFHNKENTTTTKIDDDPKQTTTTTTTELKSICSKDDELSKIDNDVPRKTPLPMSSPPEPISKRKVLPIEPISKPQSPIALLRSAPSFRIFMFRKRNRAPPQKTEHSVNETKVFAVKLSVDDFRSSPALSRDNSTRSLRSKVRGLSYEEPKPERFSKEVLRKYLKLIKPLYVKVSKRYSDKVRFSGEGFATSPSSSPSVASVSSRTEKQGKGMTVVSKHLGKSRSASSTVVGVGSPAKRSDDTLQQQLDGIQSAILHCKRSFNSREGSMYSVRKSFDGERGAKV